MSTAEYRRAGALLDPQLLAGMPEERNRSHASPCWLPAEGGDTAAAPPLACLPAFMVLGGTAAGSQLLYGMLSGHGEVAAVSVAPAAACTLTPCRPRRQATCSCLHAGPGETLASCSANPVA